MVPCGHWTPAQIDEAFATILELPSTLWQAETNFKEKSPSMLAADYHAKNLDDMIPTHLNWAQRWALWHILKKHSILFSRMLGKLPCKPVHLELTDPNAKPYHGKPYQFPRSLLPLLKKEDKRLRKIGVLCKTNNSKWAAQGFAVPKRTNRSDSSLIFACWTDSYANTHFCYLQFKKLCVQSKILESFARQTIPNGLHKALPYLKRTNRSDSSLIFACWTDSYANTHFCYLQFKKLCLQAVDLPSFPSLTSTWDFGQSNLTKKVNDLQQSSSPGASILTNALRWDYLSAQISIKRKCLPSFWTWKS
jgi:hypothetical protein